MTAKLQRLAQTALGQHGPAGGLPTISTSGNTMANTALPAPIRTGPSPGSSIAATDGSGSSP